MDWSTFLQQIHDLLLFKFPQPPYFLLLIGSLLGLSCSLPFTITLRQIWEHWSHNQSPNTLSKWSKLQLLIPVLGTGVSICVVFASILEICGLPTLPSYLVSVLLTILIGLLGWSQIGIILGKRLLRFYLAELS